jgi:hypothetical protein
MIITLILFDFHESDFDGYSDIVHDRNTESIVECDDDNDGSSTNCDILDLFFLISIILKEHYKKMISQFEKCHILREIIDYRRTRNGSNFAKMLCEFK